MSETTKNVTLVTKYPGLRIVVEPEKTVRSDRGSVVRHFQPVAVEFRNHDLPEGANNAQGTAVIEERVREVSRLEPREVEGPEGQPPMVTQVEVKHQIREVYVNNKPLPNRDLLREDERVWTFDDLMDHLKSKDRFNVDFYVLGDAPDEPKPTLIDRQREIAKATVAGDREALERVRDDENLTHRRAPVLTAVEMALQELDSEPEQSQGATPASAGVSSADGGES